MNDNAKLKVIQIYLLTSGIFLFFWWPLSHWVYPDFYHNLLGFSKGSYQDNMVKIIGTTGIIPVLLALFTASNPIKNKDMVLTLIIFSSLMALTYLFLIITNQFPKLEFINVFISIFSVIFLTLFYPWNLGRDKR